MLLCVAMLFCSCGEEERAVLGYAQPVAKHVTAAHYSDTQSYLSCFTPEAEAEYKNSDSYNESLAETLLTRGEEKTELSYKLSSKKELDSDGLKNLEKSYNKRYQASLIENSRFVQEQDLGHFMEQQKIKYTCPKCGGIISIHDKECSECQEKMK